MRCTPSKTTGVGIRNKALLQGLHWYLGAGRVESSNVLSGVKQPNTKDRRIIIKTKNEKLHAIAKE